MVGWLVNDYIYLPLNLHLFMQVCSLHETQWGNKSSSLMYKAIAWSLSNISSENKHILEIEYFLFFFFFLSVVLFTPDVI